MRLYSQIIKGKIKIHVSHEEAVPREKQYLERSSTWREAVPYLERSSTKREAVPREKQYLEKSST
jgi:hypothetical protein